jgi:SAM-dependent methyltransferase
MTAASVVDGRVASRGSLPWPAGDVLARLQQAVATAEVVRTAERLEVLSFLAGAGPASAEDVARSCGLAPAATGRLLAALSELGVLAPVPPGRFALVVDVRPSWRRLDSAWERLAECIRDGRPVVAADTRRGAAELYPGLVSQLSLLFTDAASSAARLLARLGARRMLDVGAGAAPWSIALALASPEVRVTCLDVPEVLVQTRAQVERAGLSHRFDYRPGDVFEADLPAEAYDLVLLGNVCHLFDPARNAALLRRLRPTLRPGGTLAIVDVLPSDDAQARVEISLYELGLLLRTERGQVYRAEDYARWAAGAGLGPVQAERLDGPFNLELVTTRVPDAGPCIPAPSKIRKERHDSR